MMRGGGKVKRLLGSRRLIWAAVAVAFVLRALWGVAAGDERRFYDSDSYVKIADNVLEGHGFLWGDQRVGRTPLYPLLVAGTRVAVFGRQYLVLYMVQAMLGAAVVGFFGFGARRLVGDAAGGVTAAVLSVWPFLVYYSAAVLSEVLFVFFLSAVFYFLARLFEDGRLSRAAWAGLFAGGAVLTRPSVAGLVVIFGVIVFFGVRPLRRGLAAGGVMLLAAFLVMLPWGVRNRGVTGRWIFTTCGVGASLYDGLGPQADGSSDMSFLNSMGELKGMGEVERDGYLREKALEAARGDLGRVVRLGVAKAGRFWAVAPNSASFRRPLYIAVSVLAVVPIYLAALYGLVRRVVRGRELALLAAGPVYFTLLHMVFVGSTRYRLPVAGFVVIMGAAGVVCLLWRDGGARRSDV